jgi:hypothetical protein
VTFLRFLRRTTSSKMHSRPSRVQRSQASMPWTGLHLALALVHAAQAFFLTGSLSMGAETETKIVLAGSCESCDLLREDLEVMKGAGTEVS